MLEKIIIVCVVNCLENSKFLKNHNLCLNMQMALQHFISKVHNNLNYNDQNEVSAIFLDIRKAFDTVDLKNSSLQIRENGGLRLCFRMVNRKYIQCMLK